MKVSVIGFDFPLGKRNLDDERLNRLRDIFRSSKVTPIQIEFLESTKIKDSDSVLCDKNSKLDLVIQDLEIIENQLNGGQGKELFLRCKESLEKEIILNEVPFSDEEKKLLFNLNLITLRPITFVDKENLAPIPEIIRSVYTNCGMISFFTVNERELRAWLIKKGVSVFEAAGCIHSDIQRGFIKAEVVGYEDLVKSGGLNQARSRGLIRLEDKGYLIKDGELIQIRFSRPSD